MPGPSVMISIHDGRKVFMEGGVVAFGDSSLGVCDPRKIGYILEDPRVGELRNRIRSELRTDAFAELRHAVDGG